MKDEVNTKRWQLTLAAESVADVRRLACTCETSRLIVTLCVRVAASVVVIALVHIFKSHKVLQIN